jgi:hypothetical protein
MKKLIISIIGIAIVLAVFYVVLKPAAIAPNGELSGSISPTPTTTPTATPSVTPEPNITVILPISGATVSSPIMVKGTGRVFEQQLNWRLVDQYGKKIVEGQAMTNAPDVGQFGPYSFTVTTNVKGSYAIWVFDYSAKDGAIIDLVKVPVTIK